MYKTLEAFYEKGELMPLEGKLPDIKTHVLVTFLGPIKSTRHKSHLSSLLRSKGELKNIKGNPVSIQRRIRDDW
jgi:hypothetical protein